MPTIQRATCVFVTQLCLLVRLAIKIDCIYRASHSFHTQDVGGLPNVQTDEEYGLLWWLPWLPAAQSEAQLLAALANLLTKAEDLDKAGPNTRPLTPLVTFSAAEHNSFREEQEAASVYCTGTLIQCMQTFGSP